MYKGFLSIIFFLTISCTLTKRNPPEATIFSDATECLHTAERKQKVKIPITAKNVAVSTAVIDVRLTTDANLFAHCMSYKGHPAKAAQVSSDDYLRVFNACLKEARNSSSPNATYATCVRGGTIVVEPISPSQNER